jgi:hypothetical protein
MDQVTCAKLPRARMAPMCVILGFAVFAPFSSQAADESLEYPVKAAFLFNFTKFIEWPPDAFAQSDAPLDICIMGVDPFGRALDETVAGEIVKGRKVIVQRIERAPAPESCQVVFIGAQEFIGHDKGAHSILAEFGRGVLTVGEGNTFLGEGGMIAFVIENRRVRFEINQAAASSAGLRLSSQLLKVAKSVER